MILMICVVPAAAKLLQSCLTLCDPIDGSPAGSRVPGILQARTLEWVAIAFSSVVPILWNLLRFSFGLEHGQLSLVLKKKMCIS